MPTLPVAIDAETRTHPWSRLPLRRGSHVDNKTSGAAGIWCVRSGVFQAHRMLGDGRRQITAFLFPGDVFAMPEESDDIAICVEALRSGEIAVLPWRRLNSVATERPGLATKLHQMAWMACWRHQDHLALLGRQSARERVAAFVLDMTRRAADRGGREAEIQLPMNRQAIGDYLGLNIETVSRVFSQLRRDGLIELPRHDRVLLRQAEALAREVCLGAAAKGNGSNGDGRG